MIQNNNYLNIQGFMIKDLHLKGNELLVYALIYGFCQDGESKFEGSIAYISEWISSSKQTVINTLKSLESKNLIIKHQETKNNITFNKYGVVKNFDHQSKNDNEGSQKILPGVVKKFDPIINNNNNINKKGFTPPTIDEVIEYFKSRGLTESSARRFYDYYDTGCWKDRDGNKIKNWKQKVIAVWDKPDNKEIERTPENIQRQEAERIEAEKNNLWIKNCSLINRLKTGKLVLVNILNTLLKLSEKEDFAKKVVETMTKSILTESQLEKIRKYIEGKI